MGALVLNIKTAIDCNLPVYGHLVLENMYLTTFKIAQGLLTNWCPTDLFIPSQTTCSDSDHWAAKVKKLRYI